MFFHRIRRTAGWAGLCAAVAFAAPALPAAASPHPGPTALTITPQLADTTANTGATSGRSTAGAFDVAQTRQQIRRRRAVNQQRARNQRRVDRQTRRRVRAADRRQDRRQRAADRRQDRRQLRAERRRHRYIGPRIYRNGRYYRYRDGYYYDNDGALLAAGIIGLAAGAIAGGALAGTRDTVVIEDYAGAPAPYSAEWYRRCDIKYRSFRASDGTYLGYDGVRHVCRLP